MEEIIMAIKTNDLRTAFAETLLLMHEPIKTMDDLRAAADEALLAMYEQAQGDTANFQRNFEAEFSYTSLTKEIESRGYIRSYHKPHQPINVIVPMYSKSEKLIAMVDSETLKKWKKEIPTSSRKAYLTAAMRLVMDKKAEGSLTVLYEV